jgi:hypothetical protein
LASTEKEFPAGAALSQSLDAGTLSDPAVVARQIWDLIAQRPESGSVIDLQPHGQQT